MLNSRKAFNHNYIANMDQETNPKTRVLDASQLPAQASIRGWAKLIGISVLAMHRRRARGDLPGEFDPRTNSVLVAKQTVLDALRKQPRFYTVVGENGGSPGAKPAPKRRTKQPQPTNT